jgi:hypothetical protein
VLGNTFSPPNELETLTFGFEDQSGDVKLSHEHEREDVSHTTEFNTLMHGFFGSSLMVT